MHPPSDVRYGENYVAMVYNALVQSSFWENTLFIVTFDENGAVYDHVPPPLTVCPDGMTYPPGQPVQFDFTLLGPRIPALLISPWLRPGVVDGTQYQNTSILRFVQDLLASPGELSLNKRDAAAHSIANAFRLFGLQEPRTDCPLMEIIPGFQWDIQNKEKDKARTPDPYQVALTKQYASLLPGHPDSGKVITRQFSTYADLDKYREERTQAAIASHAQGGSSAISPGTHREASAG